MNKLHRRHYPAEIFGYPPENKSDEANINRQKYLCPFANVICSKESRLLSYPMGICSVWWPNNNPIATCPNRFLENKKIFLHAAKYAFRTNNNILLFPEVKLQGIGIFDFVLVKHKPVSNIIEDFCVVEFQTDSTTATGKLVEAMKDYTDGKDITQYDYRFGMNTYNTIKLSFIQMLNKGQVFEFWNKKIIWAVQKYVFTNMIDRFNLKNMKFDKKDTNLFFIYDIDYRSDPCRYHLILKKIRSSTKKNLMTAFQTTELPKIDVFLKVLRNRMKQNLGIKL